MSEVAPSGPDASSRNIVESVARVVAVDGGIVWLEPEQTSACGGCQSAAACGTAGGDSRKLAARRFPIANDFDGRVGDRVVVGVCEGALLRGFATAYGLPLLTMIGTTVAAHLLTGSDGAAIAAAVVGLAAGLGLARIRAHRLLGRGDLSPHFLRRAFGPGPSGDCHLD